MTTQTIMDTQGWTYLSLPNYGTLCRYLVRSDDWERLEATCLCCGYHPDEHNGEDIDCEHYTPAPYTEGFNHTATGQVIHTATGQVVPLREWTDEECDDWMDNIDPHRHSDDSWEPECCKCGTTTDTKGMGGVEHREDLCEWMCGRCYEYHTEEEEKDELNAAIDASGNCFH
jgi:hypothetical protein